jgi:dTDP-4-dehydrorhamnose reductase
MPILLTGSNGMLGRDLQTALEGREVTALSRSDLDVTDPTAVRDAVFGHDVIINCAAYTKVDDAETNEDLAFAVNALGARNLAVAAKQSGARLIQVSTDYVFDGFATEPYPESTSYAPISAYGRTKAAGERFVLDEHPEGSYIVRTAWLYGQHGPNFPATMLRLGRERDSVNVVTDQLGQPTWTADLAKQLVLLIDSDAPAGIYHGTNSGVASWFDFARAVFGEASLDPDKVKPTDSSQFVRPAPRPGYSVLGHTAWTRAGIEPMRDWHEALHDAVHSGIFGD